MGSRVTTKPTFSILLHRFSWDHMGLCTAASDLRKIASELRKLPPFFGLVGTMSGVCGTYVGPMLDHVGLLEAMSGLCWGYVEPMLGQERRSCGLVFSHFFNADLKRIGSELRNCRRFWAMSGPCRAYVGPMLAPCWTMLGSWKLCRGYVEPMLSPCWAKNGDHVGLCSAIFSTQI